MPKWINMTNDQVYRKLSPPSGEDRLPREDDPLTQNEQDLGFRIFRILGAGGKTYAKDLESGTIGSGQSGGEALDDLRNKMLASQG